MAPKGPFTIGLVMPEMVVPMTASQNMFAGANPTIVIPTPMPITPTIAVTIFFLKPPQTLSRIPPITMPNAQIESMSPNSSAPNPKYFVTNKGMSEPVGVSRKLQVKAKAMTAIRPGQDLIY